MYRLVAYAKNGVQRFPIASANLVLGSLPECDIYLPFTGVAKHHARITKNKSGLRIEDLGSRRGVLVNGERVQEATLEVLDEIRLGTITLLIEDIAPEMPLQDLREDASPSAVAPVITPEGMTRHLAAISKWVRADTESHVTLESLIKSVLMDFGGGVLFLCHGGAGDNPGIKFVATTTTRWLTTAVDLLDQVKDQPGNPEVGGSCWFLGEFDGQPSSVFFTSLSAMERSYSVVAALPRFVECEWSALPGFEAMSDLLIQGLVHHVGRYEPILPGQGARPDLSLAPGLILGESDAMRAVVERMQSIADPEVQVLLRGETGSGRELLARTLHLSSPRSEGPFITVHCEGTSAIQIEADLFGAEVAGREGPLRREGKIALANHGTLLLEEPQNLSMDLQARLVRFLRSGQVEGPDGGISAEADVRVLASSRESLDACAAQDRFRVDLAYRLSQFTIEVPALRNRREDLPLLIQGYINRFCHETGKRVSGITVKTMAALTRYDFPGNLRELENLARQMVYLCESGQPVDVHLLPEEVRVAGTGAVPRISESSELTLERLVASCEAAAIREALRRSHTNKSESARLLGISRNGLAMKMKRYGIRGDG